MSDVFAPSSDPAWVIEDYASDSIRETSRESRFAVSNGFLGVRSSRVINRTNRVALAPRTYVAGLFDNADGDDPIIAALVPAADWLQLRLKAGESTLDDRDYDLASHCLMLDMKRGLVLTQGRQNDATRIHGAARMLHFVSQHARAIGVQVVELRVGVDGVEVSLEAPVEESGFGLVLTGSDPRVRTWQTKNSHKRLCMSIGSSLEIAGVVSMPVSSRDGSPLWTWSSRANEVVVFERTVAYVRGEPDDSGVETRVRTEIDRARDAGWQEVLAEHEAAWARRWDASDVAISGDSAAQRALRFAIYHLISAADPGSDRVSVGARALTGEDYHGHVFWDTEIYLVPFFVLTWPEAARAMLMYRYHTLDGARAKAERMGWRGALYAWESADTGDEAAPDHVLDPAGTIVPVLSGSQEQHISADVAYATWQYWQATEDEDFLRTAGAEILFETARFWASRASADPDGTCHIRGVIGPDEYHEHVDDNAFTNVMARFNLRRALDVVTVLAERFPADWSRIAQQLRLDDREFALWRDVSETLVLSIEPKSDLIEQFAGYFQLEDIDLRPYAQRSVPMDVVLGHERIDRSQIVKQADVVALLALLPDEFTAGEIARNFEYYEPRCAHGSSLSRVFHAVVAARLGKMDQAERYFREVAAIDLSDTHATISGGIHIAAQGGVWLAAVMGFAGVALREDGLAFDPHVPAGWKDVAFRLQWRGRRVHVALDTAGRRIVLTLEDGAPMRVSIGAAGHDLTQTAPIGESFG